MSKYYATLYTDDSNVKGWEDLNPDEIHHIDFKGKWYDEVRYGRWEDVEHAPDKLLYATCSVCGKRQTIESMNYCGECGARMEASE